MRRPFRLLMVKRDGVLFEGRAEHLRLPGMDGTFGVLAHHAPLVAKLGVGRIDLRPYREPEDVYFSCTGGVVEISRGNRVTVLLDAGERAEEIDIRRAEAAAERARERLARAAHDRSIDASRAEAALMRAIARIRLARKREKE